MGPAYKNVSNLSLRFLKNRSAISLTLRPSQQMTISVQREPVAIWQETASKLNKQKRFEKTKQQERVIRQQLSVCETSVQIEKGVMQRVTKCEDQCEGCRS